VSGDIENVKEYSVATEALGRPLNFNPKADNIVRVQVQRLRTKLHEYYCHEGSADPVRIVIPVGHYAPQYRPPSDFDRTGGDAGAAETPRYKVWRVRAPRTWKILAAASVILNLALALAVFEASRRVPSGRSLQDPLSSSLAFLWGPFVNQNSSPPLIVYSNPSFLRSEQGDLYRFSHTSTIGLSEGTRVSNLAGFERTSPIPPHLGVLYYHDAYTGIGEVVAAAKISRLLSIHGVNFSIQRSDTVSIDNIRASNVIFLGSTMEDRVLGELPLKTQLVFVNGKGTRRSLAPVIRDLSPSEGQLTTYTEQRNPATGTLEGEYALISLLPGIDPSRRMMVLEGISTLGTEAAAEFAVSPESMRSVAALMDASRGSAARSPYFQALLRVVIRSGAVAQISCISARILHER
ncbi:MAG: hypothetical protein ACRD2G_18950, partial [Terriglobia bacterium]